MEIYNRLDNHLRDKYESVINDAKARAREGKRGLRNNGMARVGKVGTFGGRVSNSDLIRYARKAEDLLPADDWKLIESFSRLRNAITHPLKNGLREPIAEPLEEIVIDYERIVQDIIAPPPILEFECVIRWEHVYHVDVSERVFDVVRTMVEKTYTHVPVMDSQRMIGVFSENCFFSHLAAHGEIRVGGATTMAEIRQYLVLDNHRSEKFEFISSSARVHQLARMFLDHRDEHSRLAVVFITPSGASTERPLGMVTAYDLAGRS